MFGMESGIGMMLKSMGIDPEEIQKQLIGAVQQISAQQKAITDRLDGLAAQQVRINDSLMRIELKLDTVPNDVAMNMLAQNKEQVDRELERMVADGRNNSNNSVGFDSTGIDK